MKVPGGAERIERLALRAGLRSRVDQRPRSCLVRVQDDRARIGYVAQYVDGKATTAYWWRILSCCDKFDCTHPPEPPIPSPVHRIGFRDLARRITLTGRLYKAQQTAA